MARGTREAAARLGIRHPIIQGPFGGGLSTPQLVAAVSARGGLGSYGAHILAPEAIMALTAELRARTTQPFALNLWVSDHDPGGQELSRADFDRVWRIFAPYFKELGLAAPEPPARYHHRFTEQVEALLAARPPVFSFVFGVPPAPILAECRRLGIVTVGAATSVAEAQALEAAGVELIVATGCEAGGHRPSFLSPAEDSLIGTFVLTQLVSARVRAPVIAAGGIVDGHGLRAALALGAQAVQLGTAFLACEESGATAAHRAILFDQAASHTTLTRTYTGRLARGVRNRLVEELEQRKSELPPFPVQAWFVSQIKAAAMAAGRTDLVSLYGSQAAPNLRHHSAGELMDSLIAELAAP